MTVQELRLEIAKDWCGCGAPEDAAATLTWLLAYHDSRSEKWRNDLRWSEFRDRIPDSGIRYIVLYWLDHRGWTEHGGSVDGAWLTKRGQEVLDALLAYGADDATVDHCVHGYGVDEPFEDCPECAKEFGT